MSTAAAAPARNPLVEFPPEPERLRAVRYAAGESEACLAELRAREIPHVPVELTELTTIDTPVFVTGSLHGGVVLEHFHPSATRPRYGHLMDCRLALALDDFAIIAADHGIAKIRYNSLQRGRWVRKRGVRHAAGVAIDVVDLVKRDGEVLDVLRDFRGDGIGKRTCGPGAAQPSDKKARELRDLVCALHEARSFNLILTPHYDYRHKNHLHLEVRRGIRWFLTQ